MSTKGTTEPHAFDPAHFGKVSIPRPDILYTDATSFGRIGSGNTPPAANNLRDLAAKAGVTPLPGVIFDNEPKPQAPNGQQGSLDQARQQVTQANLTAAQQTEAIRSTAAHDTPPAQSTPRQADSGVRER